MGIVLFYCYCGIVLIVDCDCGRWGGVDVSLVLIPRSASDECAWHEVMASQILNMCIAQQY